MIKRYSLLIAVIAAGLLQASRPAQAPMSGREAQMEFEAQSAAAEPGKQVVIDRLAELKQVLNENKLKPLATQVQGVLQLIQSQPYTADVLSLAADSLKDINGKTKIQYFGEPTTLALLLDPIVRDIKEAAEIQQAIAASQGPEEKKAAAATQQISKPNAKVLKFDQLPEKRIELPASIQHGADCGYDASKNAVLAVKFLGDPNLVKGYLENPKQFPRAELGRAIEKERGNGSQEFLWDDEVEKVILPMLTEKFKANPELFTVIGNVVQASANIRGYLDAMTSEKAATFKKAIKKIRTDANAVQGFILNDAAGEAPGHWIAVVVQRKKDSVIYYIIDSVGIAYRSQFPDQPVEGKFGLRAQKEETKTRVDALVKIIKQSPI